MLRLESKKDVTNVNDTDAITWKSATLVFDKTITTRLRFTMENPSELSGAVFKVSFGDDINFTNAELDPKDMSNKTYYIDITDFTPTDYETSVTVTLNNNGGNAVSETVTYSIMSYIANKRNSETMKTLVRALYDYGVSGKAYELSINN